MAATTAQCIFCFDVLSANLEKRKHTSLARVEELWSKHRASLGEPSGAAEADDEGQLQRQLQEEADAAEAAAQEGEEGGAPRDRPRAAGVARLQTSTPVSRGSSASSSATTLLSGSSSSSSTQATSQASSRSSLLSAVLGRTAEPEFPVFVTWNESDARGHKMLRGCVGTFEAAALSSNLQTYSITSALHDHRFSPISQRELPGLSCSLTLLANFTPCEDPLAWELGTHGLRISFRDRGTRYGATYLPDVAPEQGWTKEETVVSLMRKAGWSGSRREWRSVSDLKAIKYEGMKASAHWDDYRGWRDWCRREGLL